MRRRVRDDKQEVCIYPNVTSIVTCPQVYFSDMPMEVCEIWQIHVVELPQRAFSVVVLLVVIALKNHVKEYKEANVGLVAAKELSVDVAVATVSSELVFSL